MHDVSATHDRVVSTPDGAAIGTGVIAVVRTRTPADALTIARGLAATDVAGIEITMTVPDAAAVIATLVAEGVERVGAGTIRTPDQLGSCIDAGAAFLVSPHLDPVLVDKIKEAFFTFPWEGSTLKAEFKNEDRFIPITYQKDWSVIRKIDAATGVKYTCK